MTSESDYASMLAVALQEARTGMAEGGIPIGAALFHRSGRLLGSGHNRRVQEGDPSVHGETDAFRKAGRQRNYRDTIMVTTLAPCWYCSGLIVQFQIGAVVVGESRTFRGGIDWLRERGIEVIDLDSPDCAQLLESFITKHPEVWNRGYWRAVSQASEPASAPTREFPARRAFPPPPSPGDPTPSPRRPSRYRRP